MGVRQKTRAIKLHKSKMRMFLEEADTERDGSISKEEFLAITKDPHVKLWLSSMELDAGDALNLFGLIDQSGDGVITLDELVQGVSKLRGPARSIDLCTLMRDHN